MARDVELDRLKAAQEQAFQRKQNAYQAQQRAWDVRSSKRDAMNRAYEAKDQAWKVQDASWRDFQSVRSSNGPRIDSLNVQQERAYQNMKDSFDRASAAHDCRDGASARMYADQGHAYKAESQGYVAERRRLVDEIRSARARHEPNQQAFQQAKRDFESKRREFQDAKAEHERKQADFKQAKVEHEKARDAFRTRLEKVKTEAQKRRDDRRSLAEKAGVPYEYRDKVWVSKKPDGTINLYFGGVDMPDGPGHGHYVLNANGVVTYARNPFDPHGAHNFKLNQADYFDAIRTESVSGSDEFGFRCMYKGMPATVETGYDSVTGRQKINIYYGAPGGLVGPGHGHAIAYRDDPFTIIEDRPPK